MHCNSPFSFLTLLALLLLDELALGCTCSTIISSSSSLSLSI